MENWIEKFKNGDFVINCETEAEANKLMEILALNEIGWHRIGDTKEKNNFEHYMSETCYNIENDRLWYANIDYYIDEEHRKVVKFSELKKHTTNKKENKNMKTKKTTKTNIYQTIYNPPATIIMWTDETKTVVKTSANDDYDPVFGFLMAYFQKNSGMTKTQVGLS